MNFDLTEEQDLLQETVRQFAEQRVHADAAARDLRRQGRPRHRAVARACSSSGWARSRCPTSSAARASSCSTWRSRPRCSARKPCPGPFLGHSLAGLAIAVRGQRRAEEDLAAEARVRRAARHDRFRRGRRPLAARAVERRGRRDARRREGARSVRRARRPVRGRHARRRARAGRARRAGSRGRAAARDRSHAPHRGAAAREHAVRGAARRTRRGRARARRRARAAGRRRVRRRGEARRRSRSSTPRRASSSA